MVVAHRKIEYWDFSVKLTIVNPLKPNVPSKGHCDHCNKTRNKT
jgi:hypothetical protein